MMIKQLLLATFLIASTPVNAQEAPGNVSQMTTEIQRLEEQVRQIRGENERLQHEINQMREAHKRFQQDVEFRLNNGGSAMPTAMPAIPPADIPAAVPTTIPAAAPAGGYPPPALPAPTTVDAPNLPTGADFPNIPAPEMGSVTIPPAANTGFETYPDPQTLRLPGATPATPRELYNKAFELLNQGDYPGAESAFAQFTSEYKEDPLIGNAWYWLGETHYVRRDYVKAADSFRQGFSMMEDGPKAGDNLLKLAMSLAALEKDNEACVVLKQVDSNYSSNSSALKGKTEQELKRLGC